MLETAVWPARLARSPRWPAWTGARTVPRVTTLLREPQSVFLVCLVSSLGHLNKASSLGRTPDHMCLVSA